MADRVMTTAHGRATALSALSAIAQVLAHRQELSQGLENALLFCLEAAGLSAGAVYVADGDRLRVCGESARSGGSGAGTHALEVHGDLLWAVFQAGRPQALPTADAPHPAGPGLLAGLDSKSALLVPFGGADAPAGLLLLASQSHDLVEEDSLPFARALAAQFAQAVALGSAFDRVRASDARNRALMESANDGVGVLSADGVILEANRRMEEIFGLPRSGMAGRHVSEFTLDPAAPAAFAEVVARGAGRIDNVDLTRADGSTVHLDFSLSTIEIGGTRQVLSLARDVTERVRAEQLREERAKLVTFGAAVNMALTSRESLAAMLQGCAQAMVDHLDAALARVWVLDPQENVLTLVASAGMPMHAYGGHARIPVGQSKIGLIAQDRQPHLTNDLERDPRVSDPEWTRREGLVAFAGYPLIVDGDLVGVTGLFARRPLTEFTLQALAAAADSIGLGVKRKNAERDLELRDAQLRQAQKMEAVGQLAGGVAHDFNNLLGVVTGNSELLLRALSEHDPRRARVDQILRAADRAAALTRQLLAFSRKQVLELRVLDLNAVVSEFEKMLRRVLGENVQLVTVFSPDLGRIKADAGQIEQVIMNLAVNARDAIDGSGRLVIETANVDWDTASARTRGGLAPGAYVMLAVSDTGHGMDAETRARIFEPFFTTKGPGKGTGLGLATVYGIVKQCGGHVDVHSEPNAGTSFQIYFPRVHGDAVLRVAPKTEAGPRGSETVLLVEDDDDLRGISREILEEGGYRVVEAAHPDAALEAARRVEGTIALMVTDVIMPAKSGRQLAAELRSARPETRVLYISGYTGEAMGQQGMLGPDTSFLQKPFAADALLHKVREVLDAPPGRAPRA